MDMRILLYFSQILQERPVPVLTSSCFDNNAFADDDTADDSLSFKVASVLSQVYAKFQGKAGETVGVKPGAAWREALEAASMYGGKQVTCILTHSSTIENPRLQALRIHGTRLMTMFLFVASLGSCCHQS